MLHLTVRCLSGVALCEEGVDRNAGMRGAYNATDVALCEEGVDRNPDLHIRWRIRRLVALCEEGVDRNIFCRDIGMYGRRESPSAKRAWIEINHS